MNRNECLCVGIAFTGNYELVMFPLQYCICWVVSCVVQLFKSICCLFLFVFHFRQFLFLFSEVYFASFFVLAIVVFNSSSYSAYFPSVYTLWNDIKICIRHTSQEAKRIRSVRSVSRTIRIVFYFSVYRVKINFADHSCNSFMYFNVCSFRVVIKMRNAHFLFKTVKKFNTHRNQK